MKRKAFKTFIANKMHNFNEKDSSSELNIMQTTDFWLNEILIKPGFAFTEM